ncbi:MAG: hypothetical protein H6746_20105 [Deltaproteobacteria bacterium]|nr:hypothetical protein [Deltaproteobacteria bacterium]
MEELPDWMEPLARGGRGAELLSVVALRVLAVTVFAGGLAAFMVLLYPSPDGVEHGARSHTDPLIVVASFLLWVLSLGVASALLLRVAARRRPRCAVELLTRDRRPPVLFLRAFADDGQLPLWRDLATSTMIPCVEAIVHRAFAPVGPMVALARSEGERLPAGTVPRLQVSDARWRDAVRWFAERAALVVVVPGPGAGLAWELGFLWEAVAPERVVLVLPPARWLPRDSTAGVVFEGPWLGALAEVTVPTRGLALVTHDALGRPRVATASLGPPLRPSLMLAWRARRLRRLWFRLSGRVAAAG